MLSCCRLQDANATLYGAFTYVLSYRYGIICRCQQKGKHKSIYHPQKDMRSGLPYLFGRTCEYPESLSCLSESSYSIFVTEINSAVMILCIYIGSGQKRLTGFDI